MSDRIEHIAKEIKQRLVRQLEYYQKILELSMEEKSALEKQDTRSLMKLLSWKQKYINKLDKLKDELLVYKQKWEPVKDSAAAQLRQEFKELTDQTEATLKSIIELEKNNIDTAQHQKNGTSRKISEYKYNTKALRSYLGSGRAKPRSIMDKKT